MQFNDIWHRQKTPPSPPPDNYFELCLSVNTFCMLVWTLFGEKCDYYKGLLEVYDTLDQQEVCIIMDSFMANVCCQITWAILSNGCSFFNTVLVGAQFCRGEHFKWLTSLIHKIMDNVHFAKLIDCPFYQVEWLITPANWQGTAGNNGGGGSYGGGEQSGGKQRIKQGTTPPGEKQRQWRRELPPTLGQ